MISVNDIHWAAGFLEGEGSFEGNKGKFEVSAAQVQRWPVDRLNEIFSGTLNLRHKPSRVMWKPAFFWRVGGPRAIGLMMTLYCLMSPKRQGQILKAINHWKSRAVAPMYRTHCPKGHKYDKLNTGFDWRGRRYCKRCSALRSMNQHYRNKKHGTAHSKFQLSLQF